ncbi:hypothetical protein EI42_01867 [Thermosporothrix hazakensis]|jgi:photosystem II stability/assembly factor-like uncharacterized protein|uniref:Xyloglucanase n=2 Tax=Thermosporothrix hazakensis TaxID=644383 RepID=A0A326UBM3_THEHA|nr:xyloglucanase [Thermosporothrix hazakensis]PZW32775.1 hypothetical protein EI42_01867 [Thermosporothrix hazakensis]
MTDFAGRSRRNLLMLSLALLIVPILFIRPAPEARAASQSYSWKQVVTGGGGGFVVNVLFNQKEKDLLYARTDIGGAYRWDPATGSWTQLLAWVGPDQWNMAGVESIATDPVDPNRLYIAAGTYTNSWTDQNGVILRSTDRGKTFQQTPLPFKLGGNMPGRGMGERLAIDPNKNSILYLGTRSGHGLWKSTDSGVTWSQVSNFPNTGPFVDTPGDPYLGDEVGVVWVTFDPASSTPGNPTQTIYVGVADNRSGATNIYRTTDAGKTWEAVPGQPTCNVSGTKVTCTGGATWDTSTNATTGYLPHQGKLDAQGTLYITYSDWEGPYNGSHGDVWKFEPKTATWTKISPVPGSDTSNNYFGYGGLAVDMQHPGTLVVASVNSWWPDAQLFRTTDGGKTWAPIWEWASYPSRSLHYTIDISDAPWLHFGNTNPVDPVPAVKLGWMIEGMNIDPFNSDRLMYGTGATLYGTTNLTAWDTGGKVAIKTMARGIEETSVSGLISPPANAHLYSVVADVSGWRHDDLTKSPDAMYSVPYAGSYAAIDYAELKPDFLVRVGYGDPKANPPVTSSAFSYDGGKNWFAGNKDIPGITGNGGTVAAAADASSVVWAPKDAAVSYSTDNGNSWIASKNVPKNAVVGSDRVNPKVFYAYGEGKFWISADGGATFTASGATGLPASDESVEVRAVPGHEGDIWLTGSKSGIWHSTDGGKSFTKLAKITAADALGFGKAAPGKDYMALYTSATIDGVRGLFRSDDGGASWVRINDEQHQYGIINCVTGDPRIYGRVYACTNGFGIVYGDLNDTTPTSTPTQTPTKTPSPTPSPTNTPTPNPTSGPGNVTAKGVVTSSSAWFTEEQVQLHNTAPLTDLTVTITVQKTQGVTYSGLYATSGTISGSYKDNGSTITYTYTLKSGQTLPASSNVTLAAQFSGNGTPHATSADTWSVKATSGGTTTTLNGHF